MLSLSDIYRGSSLTSDLMLKRKAEADAFNNVLEGFPRVAFERFDKDIFKRVAPTSQDLPKALHERTRVAIAEAIKAGDFSSEEMATLQKVQQLIENTPSIYFGSGGFYIEMPSLIEKQALIEEQRKNHESLCAVFKIQSVLDEDEIAIFRTSTQKSIQEQQETIDALRGQLTSITTTTQPKKRRTDSTAQEINVKGENGNTRLHAAILNGMTRHTIQKLCSIGADSRIQNNDGDTPLHLVVRHNLSRTLGILLRFGQVDLTLKNSKGQTCLDEATGRMLIRLQNYQAGDKEVSDPIEEAQSGLERPEHSENEATVAVEVNES